VFSSWFLFYKRNLMEILLNLQIAFPASKSWVASPQAGLSLHWPQTLKARRYQVASSPFHLPDSPWDNCSSRTLETPSPTLPTYYRMRFQLTLKMFLKDLW
jgi:hypothetical protein